MKKKSCPNFGHFGQNPQHVAKSATLSNIKQHFLFFQYFIFFFLTIIGNENKNVQNGHFLDNFLKSSKYFLNKNKNKIKNIFSTPYR